MNDPTPFAKGPMRVYHSVRGAAPLYVQAVSGFAQPPEAGPAYVAPGDSVEMPESAALLVVEGLASHPDGLFGGDDSVGERCAALLTEHPGAKLRVFRADDAAQTVDGMRGAAVGADYVLSAPPEPFPWLLVCAAACAALLVVAAVIAAARRPPPSLRQANSAVLSTREREPRWMP